VGTAAEVKLDLDTLGRIADWSAGLVLYRRPGGTWAVEADLYERHFIGVGMDPPRALSALLSVVVADEARQHQLPAEGDELDLRAQWGDR
jgi:hypothetical protein